MAFDINGKKMTPGQIKKMVKISLFEQLVDLVDAAKGMSFNFYVKKQRKSGVRLRNSMIKIKKLAHEIRKEVILERDKIEKNLKRKVK